MKNKTRRTLRHAAVALLGFLALNAFLGGYYALSGAPDVPTEWLEGSPFQNYFVPGLVLFVVVGGALLFASASVLLELRVARSAMLTAVIILFVWLLAQVLIIGYVSWMQPATAFTALLILFLAFLGERKNQRQNDELG